MKVSVNTTVSHLSTRAHQIGNNKTTTGKTNRSGRGRRHGRGGKQDGKKAGYQTKDPYSTEIGKTAIQNVKNVTTDDGIAGINSKLKSLTERVGNVTITAKDTTDGKRLIEQIAVACMKSSGVTAYLTGLPTDLAKNVCANAVISALVTLDPTKVVPLIAFVPAQREYHQAQGMVYAAQKLRNRLSPQDVQDSTVITFKGGADGLKKIQEITDKYPILANFFKPFAPCAFPTDIEGVKMLANAKPWERGAMWNTLDAVVVKGQQKGNLRPGFDGKAIQKILGSVNNGIQGDGITITGQKDFTSTQAFVTPDTTDVVHGDILKGGVARNGTTAQA